MSEHLVFPEHFPVGRLRLTLSDRRRSSATCFLARIGPSDLDLVLVTSAHAVARGTVAALSLLGNLTDGALFEGDVELSGQRLTTGSVDLVGIPAGNLVDQGVFEGLDIESVAIDATTLPDESHGAVEYKVVAYVKDEEGSYAVRLYSGMPIADDPLVRQSAIGNGPVRMVTSQRTHPSASALSHERVIRLNAPSGCSGGIVLSRAAGDEVHRIAGVVAARLEVTDGLLPALSSIVTVEQLAAFLKEVAAKGLANLDP